MLLGVGISHQGFHLGFHILEFGEFELMALDFFLPAIRLLNGFERNFHLWWGFFSVLLKHLQHCVSFLLQLELLLGVGIADDVLDGRGGAI